MVTCKFCVMVLVVVLAVLVYQSLKTVDVDYEFKTNVRAPVNKVFDYLKDPENIRDVVPNIVEVKIVDEQFNQLDEEDGLFKDVYLVTVVQDIPYKSGLTFNFTRKASASQNTIESQGNMMGFINYQIVHVVEQQKDGSVDMTERCAMQMPRGLSWLVASNVKTRHQQINNKIKEILEKGVKVSSGTQT